MEQNEYQQKLQVEVDLRLEDHELWDKLDNIITSNLVDIAPDLKERLGELIRAAYGFGYLDALKEPVRGQMCINLGYKVPKRKKLEGGSEHAA